MANCSNLVFRTLKVELILHCVSRLNTQYKSCSNKLHTGEVSTHIFHKEGRTLPCHVISWNHQSPNREVTTRAKECDLSYAKSLSLLPLHLISERIIPWYLSLISPCPLCGHTLGAGTTLPSLMWMSLVADLPAFTALQANFVCDSSDQNHLETPTPSQSLSPYCGL